MSRELTDYEKTLERDSYKQFLSLMKKYLEEGGGTERDLEFFFLFRIAHALENISITLEYLLEKVEETKGE